MAPLIPLPDSLEPFLKPYLPNYTHFKNESRPHVTLTYATSLDSRISIGKGKQTVISHMETKSMTHYIRSKHNGILVGIGTVLADDPSLNCRTENSESPRPIIIDPHSKWKYIGSKVDTTCQLGQGKSPIILVRDSALVDSKMASYLSDQGGKILKVPVDKDGRIQWDTILEVLIEQQITSLMVEGGAKVINDLLVYRDKKGESVVDSLIVTIGPVYLGENGVEVSPSKDVSLKNIQWWTGIQDSVLCATIK